MTKKLTRRQEIARNREWARIDERNIADMLKKSADRFRRRLEMGMSPEQAMQMKPSKTEKGEWIH